MSNTKKLALSAVFAALYIAVTLLTHAFSFGAIQVRISTSIYALAFLLPFLTVPLGLANGLANLFGGNGMWDVFGGVAIGIIVAGACALVARQKWSPLLVIPIIIALPALIVPLWLAPILALPYLPLVGSIALGQIAPGILGYFLVRSLNKHMEGQRS